MPRSKCTACNKCFYRQADDIRKLNRLTTNQPDLFHDLPDDIQGKLGALNFDSWDDVESTLQCADEMVQKIKQLSENAVERRSKRSRSRSRLRSDFENSDDSDFEQERARGRSRGRAPRPLEL